MNSYNNIKKVQYESKSEKEPVSLVEYIQFVDDRNEQQYAVLKFKNKLTQRLYKISFTVQSFDENDNLIEKSIIEFSTLNVNENETFVPNAKLRLDYNTKTIKVDVDFAKFETCEYKDGEFTHVQYTFDEYIKHENEKVDSKEEKPIKEKEAKKVVKKEEKKEKKVKEKFGAHSYEDITNANKTKAPLIISTIAILLFLVLSIFQFTTVKNRANYFTVGDFDYQIESSNSVSVLKYHGKSKDIVIQPTIHKFYVIALETNSFKNTNVENITFENFSKDFGEYVDREIYVRELALDNSKIKSIKSPSRKVVFRNHACSNCKMLKDVNIPNGKLSANSLFDCTSVQTIECKEFNADVNRFSDIFGHTKPEEFYYQSIISVTVPYEYKNLFDYRVPFRVNYK